MIEQGVHLIQQAVRERGLHGEYRDLGNIRTARYEDLLIFNYTQVAQYAATWTPVERVSRGLIINGNTGEIVALPWSKFYNLGENEGTKLENLPTDGFEVTDKLDGSLGILYKRSDGWAIATRGSFEGVQAAWATNYLRTHYGDVDFGTATTLLFEIIYPENRIVLDYGRRAELVLIGARDLSDGTDYPYGALQYVAELYGLPVVPAIDVQTLDDLIASQCTLTGIEGWVIRFPNGLRVKVKCEEYLRLHKIIFGLTPERVREAVLADYNTFIANIPEELRPGIETQAHAIIDAAKVEEQRVRGVYQNVRSVVGDTRKDFAMHVVRNHPNERALLFSLYDDRAIWETIVKGLDLTAVLGEALVLESTDA